MNPKKEIQKITIENIQIMNVRCADLETLTKLREDILSLSEEGWRLFVAEIVLVKTDDNSKRSS